MGSPVLFVKGLDVFLPRLEKRSVDTVKVQEKCPPMGSPVVCVMVGDILSDVRLTGGI